MTVNHFVRKITDLLLTNSFDACLCIFMNFNINVFVIKFSENVHFISTYICLYSLVYNVR